MESENTIEQFVTIEDHEKLKTMMAEVVVENNDLKKEIGELKKAIMVDSKTGLYNSRFFIERLNDAIKEINDISNKENQKRENEVKSLSVLLVDIDNFKQLNTDLGHVEVDNLLVKIAKVFKFGLRKFSDVAARLGGDELVGFMYGASEDVANQRAQSISKLINEIPFITSDGQKIEISVSIGVAELHQNDNAQSIMGNADLAMYAAKNSDKNIVRTYSGLSEEEKDKFKLKAS